MAMAQLLQHLQVQPKIAAICRQAAGKCATVGFSFCIHFSTFPNITAPTGCQNLNLKLQMVSAAVMKHLKRKIFQFDLPLCGEELFPFLICDRDFKRPFDWLLCRLPRRPAWIEENGKLFLDQTIQYFKILQRSTKSSSEGWRSSTHFKAHIFHIFSCQNWDVWNVGPTIWNCAAKHAPSSSKVPWTELGEPRHFM